MFYPNTVLGFGVGASGATVVFAASTVLTTDTTEYTFSGHAIGAPDTGRKVVVCAAAAGTVTINTVTVGGISATTVAERASGVTFGEIWEAAVPTGATADIVVTHSGATNRSGIGVFAVYGAKATAGATTTSTADPLNINKNVSSGGVIIGMGTDQSTSTYSWTGLTEAYDEIVESATGHTGGSVESAITQNLNITGNISNASTSPVWIVTNWDPL